MLTLGERTGAFEGMLTERTFEVSFVGPPLSSRGAPSESGDEGSAGGPQPDAFTRTADAVVRYSGRAVTIARNTP